MSNPSAMLAMSNGEGHRRFLPGPDDWILKTKRPLLLSRELRRADLVAQERYHNPGDPLGVAVGHGIIGSRAGRAI